MAKAFVAAAALAFVVVVLDPVFVGQPVRPGSPRVNPANTQTSTVVGSHGVGAAPATRGVLSDRQARPRWRLNVCLDTGNAAGARRLTPKTRTITAGRMRLRVSRSERATSVNLRCVTRDLSAT